MFVFMFLVIAEPMPREHERKIKGSNSEAWSRKQQNVGFGLLVQ